MVYLHYIRHRLAISCPTEHGLIIPYRAPDGYVRKKRMHDLYTLYQAPIGWSVLDRRECMVHLITSSTDCLIYVRQKGTHGLFTFFQPPTGYSLSHRSDQFIHTMSDTRCLIYVRRKENIIGLTTLYQVPID